MTVRIELLYVAGCPHVAATRELIAGVLAELGVVAPIHERVGDFPSPTVLVDGIDVVNGGPPGTGRACRLDRPSQHQIAGALGRG